MRHRLEPSGHRPRQPSARAATASSGQPRATAATGGGQGVAQVVAADQTAASTVISPAGVTSANAVPSTEKRGSPAR